MKLLKLFCISAVIISVNAFSAESGNKNANNKFLVDTVKYENVRVKNIFFAPYKNSSYICAYFDSVKAGGKDASGCAMIDNGSFQVNANNHNSYPSMYSALLNFYDTDDVISVYLKKDVFKDYDTSISDNEIVAVGSCNDWCFGETIK